MLEPGCENFHAGVIRCFRKYRIKGVEKMAGLIYRHGNSLVNEFIVVPEITRILQETSSVHRQRHVERESYLRVITQLPRQNQSGRRRVYQAQCQIEQRRTRRPGGSPLVTDPSLSKCSDGCEQDYYIQPSALAIGSAWATRGQRHRKNPAPWHSFPAAGYRVRCLASAVNR